jgi:DNA adenine methylase
MCYNLNKAVVQGYCSKEGTVLFDINKGLRIVYKVVQTSPQALVEQLYSIEKKYFSLSEDDKKRFYYEIRDLYNSQKKEFDFSNFNKDWIVRAAYK